VKAAEYRALVAGKKAFAPDAPKRPKYRNEKQLVDGITFDSKREASRYLELKMAERYGKIAKLRRQVAFALNVGDECIGKLILDFVYERDGVTVYEDVKSDATTTPMFRWKAKHFLAQYGREIEIVK
jgi:hypothetical protein